MNKDKIASLAREYAEEEVKDTAVEDLPDGFKENVIQRNANHFEKHLRWLLRRFCLVEKEALEKFYQEAKERYFSPDDEVEKTMYGGRMSMLEYLFPEIGKEVEK